MKQSIEKENIEKAKHLEEVINETLTNIKNTNIANPRWLAIATTDFEKGLLELNHALSKNEKRRVN